MYCNLKEIPEGALRLLVLDSSYCLEAIRSRGLERSVTCRDLGGFFDHVWTVHPFATLVSSEAWSCRYGKPTTYALTPVHTFIEGKIGRFSALKHLSALNFLASQISILLSLVRLVRVEKISFVRVGDPLYLGLFGWAISRLCGIPLIVRVGGNYDKTYETTGRTIMPRLFFFRSIEKIVERFVLKRADLVAGANKDNLNYALANGAKPESSTLFRYGNLIDRLHFEEPSSRLDCQSWLDDQRVEKDRFILYIGRLEKVKHPDDVVRTLAEVRKRGQDVKAILAGDGQLRADLIHLASQLGVQDKVILCGNVSQQLLARIIPLAEVVVSPHTGRALSEAALGAAPIVAYDVDWQSELVETGVTGELVPHLNLNKMVDAVEHLLNNPAYARSMGDAIRVRVIKMMDPIKLDKHERDKYRALLK